MEVREDTKVNSPSSNQRGRTSLELHAPEERIHESAKSKPKRSLVGCVHNSLIHFTKDKTAHSTHKIYSHRAKGKEEDEASESLGITESKDPHRREY